MIFLYIYHRHSVAKQSVRFLKCDVILKLNVAFSNNTRKKTKQILKLRIKLKNI